MDWKKNLEINDRTLVSYISRAKHVKDIPHWVITIGKQAFMNSNIESIILPDDLFNIEANAFYGCKNLKGIELPNTLEHIGMSAFQDCASLETIRLSDNLQEIDMSVFKGYINLKSITIPNSVRYISDFAFEDCTSLESINIPSSVKHIGNVFKGCKNLKSIHLNSDYYCILDGISFGNCNYKTCTIYVPKALEATYKSHPYFSKFNIQAEE